MRKIFSTLLFIIILFFVTIFIFLSTTGIKTEKFNEIISKKINQSNNSLDIELKKIKFKVDIKNLSLFLETVNPSIKYQNILIPAENIKVYIDFLSIFKSTPNIKKINVNLIELDIKQIKRFSSVLKPSNLKSLIKNKIKDGRITSEIEFYLDDNNQLENYIAKGSVVNLNFKIIDDIDFKKTNFKFFADKSDILIKNINSDLENIKINDGDIKIMRFPEISIQSNFFAKIIYDNNFQKKLSKNLSNLNIIKNIDSVDASLRNEFKISFDKTYKIKNFSFKSDGDINKAYIKLSSPIKSSFIKNDISQIFLKNSKVKLNYGPEKKY